MGMYDHMAGVGDDAPKLTGAIQSDGTLSDEELARHASRAYQLASQHGEDQWLAVARMMRAYLR